MDSARHAYTHTAYSRTSHTDADSDPHSTPNLYTQTFHLKTVDIRFDFANGGVTRAKGRAATTHSLNH